MIIFIHAGWKGAFGGIIKKVIFYFKKKGSNFRNINAVIGPCISKNNYEVKEDIVTKFIKKDKKNRKFFYKKNYKTYFRLNRYIKYEIISIVNKNIKNINRDI